MKYTLRYTLIAATLNLAFSSQLLTQDNPCHNFYKKSRSERVEIVANHTHLTNAERALLTDQQESHIDAAQAMIENAIGVIPVPLGIAVYFLINSKEYLIPMATEEPSVIAAASRGAKLAQILGGFTSSCTPSIMIGQIQVTHIPDRHTAIEEIIRNKSLLLTQANQTTPSLIKRGGGAADLEVRQLHTSRGEILIIHLFIDVKDAMGANITDTMVESIAPTIQELTGGTVTMSILSNLATARIAKAQATWPKESIGEDTIERILDAHAFACADPYRCATHNKGIMNGIDAVALATGNDWRALEAAAHAFACLDGHYKPLTTYKKDLNGNLVGEITIPMPIGIVGGSIAKNPYAQLCLRILTVESAQELATVMACVGLAQNFAALYALVTEGIQAGHMKLHKKNSEKNEA